MVLNGQTRATRLWTGGSRESGGRLRGLKQIPSVQVRDESEDEARPCRGGDAALRELGVGEREDRGRRFGPGAEPDRLTTHRGGPWGGERRGGAAGRDRGGEGGRAAGRDLQTRKDREIEK